MRQIVYSYGDNLQWLFSVGIFSYEDRWLYGVVGVYLASIVSSWHQRKSTTWDQHKLYCTEKQWGYGSNGWQRQLWGISGLADATNRSLGEDYHLGLTLRLPFATNSWPRLRLWLLTRITSWHLPTQGPKKDYQEASMRSAEVRDGL